MTPSEQSIRAAARVLADRHADACGVDREDNWNIYSEDFVEDARAALTTILAELEALRADAARWQCVARHWESAQFRWDHKAPGNPPSGLSLTMSAAVESQRATELASFIDEWAAIDAARLTP